MKHWEQNQTSPIHNLAGQRDRGERDWRNSKVLPEGNRFHKGYPLANSAGGKTNENRLESSTINPENCIFTRSKTAFIS